MCKPEQCKGDWDSRVKKILKRQMVRKERKRAKQDPECQPHYKRFDGWST